MTLALLALPALVARSAAAQPAERAQATAPAPATAASAAPVTAAPSSAAPSSAAPSSAAPTAAPGSVAPTRGETSLPDLAVVLEMVRTDAPDVALGRANVEASKSAGVGARRLPLGNPLLTVFAEHGDGVTRDVFIDGTLELPIEIWGQRGRRIEEADALVDYSRASLEVLRAQSMAQAIEAYGLASVSIDRLEVIGDAIVAARVEADVYQARVEQRDATIRDARVATMEVARNEILLVEARADLQDGLAQLERLTGTRFEPKRAASTADSASRVLAMTAPSGSAGAPLVAESKAEAAYYDKVGARAASEGKMPFSLLLRGGRGDLAETRLGGGFVLGFPFFQYNQAERARATAQAERARTAAEIQKRALLATEAGLHRELEQLREARRILEVTALPASREAVLAAEETQRAGKSDLLPVLISRRDYAALRLRRLDILAREWRVVGNLVRITGTKP